MIHRVPVFRRVSMILLAGLFGHFGMGQALVTHITAPGDVQGRKGVIYSLPRTVIKIDVQFRATYEYRGPYAAQAESILGITDIIDRNSERYEIVQTKISWYTEPDPEQYYFVSLEEKADKSFEMMLGPSGTMASARAVTKATPVEAPAMKEVEDIFPYFKAAALKEHTDTIRRIVTIDTVTIEKYLLRNSLVRQTDEEKAREAADMINVLKQDKYNILIGYQETAYEEGAMSYMVDRLEKMEMEYLKLFTGSTSTETFTRTFILVPGEEETELFQFSREDGILDRGGMPVTVSFTDLGLTGPLPDQSAAAGRTGIFYRVPGMAEVSVNFEGVTLETQRVTINQFGKVLNLPASAGNVSLDPVTGNLRHVTLQP